VDTFPVVMGDKLLSHTRLSHFAGAHSSRNDWFTRGVMGSKRGSLKVLMQNMLQANGGHCTQTPLHIFSIPTPGQKAKIYRKIPNNYFLVTAAKASSRIFIPSSMVLSSITNGGTNRSTFLPAVIMSNPRSLHALTISVGSRSS
jgi:hypothetical protein